MKKQALLTYLATQNAHGDTASRPDLYISYLKKYLTTIRGNEVIFENFVAFLTQQSPAEGKNFMDKYLRSTNENAKLFQRWINEDENPCFTKIRELFAEDIYLPDQVLCQLYTVYSGSTLPIPQNQDNVIKHYIDKIMLAADIKTVNCTQILNAFFSYFPQYLENLAPEYKNTIQVRNICSLVSETVDSTMSHHLQNLEDSSEYVRLAACEVLGQLCTTIPEKQKDLVMHHLLEKLQDDSIMVRETACQAITKLFSEISDTQKEAVINGLLAGLEDDTAAVRLSACNSLVQLYKALNDTQKETVANGLLEKMTDKSAWVREATCSALSRIITLIPVTQKNAMIENLLSELEVEDKDVMQAAWETFVQLYIHLPDDKKGDNIIGLVQRLQDNQETARDIACQILGKLGKICNAIPNQQKEAVIACLLANLSYESDLVRQAACQSIAQFGAAMDETQKQTMITKFIDLLKDKSPMVRETACNAFSQICPIIPADKKEEVIDNLILRLQDENVDDVMESACDTIVKLSNALSTNNMCIIVDCLLNRFRESSEIKHATCYALGKLSHAVSSEQKETIIEHLLIEQQNRSPLVREAVCNALALLFHAMPENQKEEVIKNLLTELQDEDEDVRHAACKDLARLCTSIPDPLKETVILALFEKLNTTGEREWVHQAVCEALAFLADQSPAEVRLKISFQLMSCLINNPQQMFTNALWNIIFTSAVQFEVYFPLVYGKLIHAILIEESFELKDGLINSFLVLDSYIKQQPALQTEIKKHLALT